MQLPALNPGETVDLVAPGWGVEPEVLQSACQLVADLGFAPRANCLEASREPWRKGADQARADLLYHALSSDDSQAVWCLRGGYGTGRLLPFLDAMPPLAEPKWVLGLSDITALHAWLIRRCGWPVLHAPVLSQVLERTVDAQSQEEISGLLMGRQREVVFEGLTPLNASARQSGTVRGMVTGGNLSLVQALVGTPWQFETKGRILFLEEVDERAYRIDRMLTHLSQARAMEGALALIFGDITGGDEHDGAQPMDGMLRAFAECQPFPVLQGLPSGHGPCVRALPLNGPAALARNEKRATLTCIAGTTA